MKSLFGLLVMLAGVSHGMETHCDATLDGAQCYGALGGTVSLQLMTIDSKAPDILLKTNSTGFTRNILQIRNKTYKKVKIDKSIETRAHFFFNNGTFRIDNTERSDSAEYRLETFNSDGKTLGTRGLQLFIEAPVSSPQLSSQCLTHGEMRVTCSSEGDGPQYSWTLDGHTQRDTEASPGDETNTITLKKGLSGDLTCTVKNKINSVTVSKIISPCEDIIGIVTGSLTGIVLVLVMVLAVYCVQKKNKPPKTPVNVNSQDVEYADVRTLKNQMRQQERKVEYGHLKVAGGPLQPMEVDYGQIEILEGLRKVDTPEEEDCVYARVRKGQ
ncbi:uncharacterized protein LOC121546793 isoform X1 [Coregonus clupeaformis]|uniref:uncharacterized protein LOC121546793 isoform X1 n=2 Tax=Coregonus clupeaformis TaxID=59861 RepID=UPI001BDFE479|nr:uncharacterized protein LOC121546793 isoform X1 [Coregonus clupeaformis]